MNIAYSQNDGWKITVSTRYRDSMSRSGLLAEIERLEAEVADLRFKLGTSSMLTSTDSITGLAHHVSKRHGITLAELTGPMRLKEFVAARREFAKLCVQQLKLGTSEIARFLGGRDHSTIYNLLTPRKQAQIRSRSRRTCIS